MTMQCKYCGTELEDDNPAIIAQLIEESIEDWDMFSNDNVIYGKPVGAKLTVPGLSEFVVVEAKKLKPSMDDLVEGYMEEGSYPQGTEYVAYVVLRYGDTFFKKTGSADSYGEIVWSGVLTPTKPKEITVTSWE